MSVHHHKAGFIHLIGEPNAGKSTLFNRLVQTPLSIVTPKPQTTRQEIIGITNTADIQAVYVDTPGHIEASNALQKGMVKSIHRSILGADILLYIVDARSQQVDIQTWHSYITHIPTFLVFNKIDLLPAKKAIELIEKWKNNPLFIEVLAISARKNIQIAELVKRIEQKLPCHPPFYDKKDISEQPIRFFVAEIIRKVIFLHYQQEVPYSTAVMVTKYKDQKDIIFIEATIYTERLSQKKILIGKNGQALERLCKEVRGELNSFLGKEIFFKPYIRTLTNWRNNSKILQQWGYN